MFCCYYDLVFGSTIIESTHYALKVPFGITALTTSNRFRSVEMQQSLFFTIKAEREQSAAERAKVNLSLWSNDYCS